MCTGCKRWPGCVAMVSCLILALVLTSIFFGHTLIGWHACFQLFNLLLQPVSEANKMRRCAVKPSESRRR